MKYKALVLVLIFVMTSIFSGCGRKAQTAAAMITESSVREAVTVAKPQEAVIAIYASLPAYRAAPLTRVDLTETFEIEKDSLKEFYGKISQPNEGLADVVILLPEESKHDDIQLALSKYKEKRMAEFEFYDILDAYSISQNAVIYEQGGYIIMLMLAENDPAREIIDQYIPL